MKICIITDSIVEPLYLDEVKNVLSELDKSMFTFKFKSGEESKTLDTVQEIYEFLIENKFERKDLLVALGGGVIGDMTGFQSIANNIRFFISDIIHRSSCNEIKIVIQIKMLQNLYRKGFGFRCSNNQRFSIRF